MKRGVIQGTRTGPSAVDAAVAAWGGGDKGRVPDWVLIFAEMCDAQSRSVVATRLGYSAPVVSQLLNGTYAGNLDRIEAVVRGAFMKATVVCPVNGDTPLDVCLADQRRTPPFASSWRMQVYRTCRGGCLNYRGGK